MPDRTVSYNFRANFGQFSAGLAAMGVSVEAAGNKLTALDRNGAKMRSGLTQIGSSAGKVGLVFAAGVGLAVRAAANFEQAMSNVQAATHETADNMDLLRQAALDAGQATQFSATEAAGAVENLAKAGISTADILGGGLTGALDLAAAGGLEVADAAEIAATALTQFRLQGEDVPHVADLLAAAAGKAQGDVSDMAMALKQSGLVAAQMGISVEETTGVLAEFASAGLLGSDAGTSFRTMLLRLANPTEESAKLMKSLGIEAYNAQGNFVGIESLAGQLQTAFEGQTQAQRDAGLATIFGSDAIRAASVLYQGGAKDVADWTDKVNDQGYAAETASIKMDNLKGDLEQLGGAFETALIGAGGGSQGPLRDLTQGLTDVINKFNKLDPAAQSSVTSLLAVTAVTGGALWFGSKVVQGVANTTQALSDLGLVSGRTSGSLGSLTKRAAGIASVAGSIALLGQAVGEVAGANIDLSDLSRDIEAAANGKNADILERIISDIQIVSDRASLLGKPAEGVNELITGFGILGGTASDKASDNIQAVDEALAQLVETGEEFQAGKFFEQLAAADLGLPAGTSLGDDVIKDFMSNFPSYETALSNAEVAADGAAGATDGLADSTAGAGDAAAAAAEDVAAMVEAMEDQRSAALDAFDAVTQYRQAMKDADKQAKESNAGIKGNSDEALKNRDTLSALAGAWNGLDQTTQGASGAFKAAKDNFIKTAVAMNVPEAAARRLARELLEIPESKVIPVSVPGTDEAKAKVQALKGFLDSLHDKTIHVNTVISNNRPGSGSTSTAGGHSQSAADDPPPPPPKTPKLGRTNNDLLSGLGLRLRGAGINTVATSGGALRAAADQQSAVALNLLAREAKGAGDETGGLKRRLSEFEKKLERATRQADKAGDALESLVGQRDSLSSSVSQSLLNDPFQGGLSEFAAQTGADKADAEAMLTALQTILLNGVDPKSTFFQQLASSGNVSLAQQFASLTRGDLATYAASFASSRDSAGAAGAFTGNEAFGAAIKQQQKVVDKFDGSVAKFEKVVNRLEAELKRRDGGGKAPAGGSFGSANVATTPKKFGGR